MAHNIHRPFYARLVIKALLLVVATTAMIYLAGCASHETAADFEPEWEKLIVEVARFPDTQPTGVAVSSTGRIFVNFPYWDRQPGMSVAELDIDGTLMPFPSRSWNKWDGKHATSSLRSFVSAQALYVDRNDFLWALDSGSPRQDSGVVVAGPKLFKIDLSDNSIAQVFYFDQKRDLAPHSSLSDFRVDIDRHIAYITDAGRGAIVIYNLKTREARTVLLGHESTKPQDGLVAQVGSHPWVTVLGQRPAYGVAGIELSKDKKWLYYHALCGRDLYRVPTDALLDERLTAGQLGTKVEYLGSTGSIVDGLWLDDDGNLFLTAIEKDSILVRRPTGELETFIADARLQWPDSLAMGPDGYLYFTTSMRHLQAPFRVTDVKRQPYYLMKVSVRNVDKAIRTKQDAQFAQQSALDAAREAVRVKQQALKQKRQAELVRAAAERQEQRVAQASALVVAAAKIQADTADQVVLAAQQQAQIAAQAQTLVELAKAQLAEAKTASQLAQQAAIQAKTLAQEARAKAQAGQQAKAQAIKTRQQAAAAKAAYEQATERAEAAQNYATSIQEQLAQRHIEAWEAQAQAQAAIEQAQQQAFAASEAQANAELTKHLAKQARQQAFAAEHAELSDQAPTQTAEVQTEP